MQHQKIAFLLANLASSITVVFIAAPAFTKSNSFQFNTLTSKILLVAQSADTANSQFQQGRDAFDQGAYELSIQLWEVALLGYQASGEQAQEAATLNQIGKALSQLNQYDQAIQRHEESLAIARRLSDLKEIANALDGIGINYAFQSNPIDALPALEESLSINRSIANRRGEADNLDHLGTVHVTQNKLPEALAYYEQSLSLSQEISYTEGQARAFTNLGYIDYQLENYTQALENYQSGLEIREQLGNRSTTFGAIQGVGGTYLKLERYDEAIKIYARGQAIARELEDYDKETAMLRSMGDASKLATRYEDAITYYTQGLNQARLFEDRELEADFLLLVGTIQAALDEHESATNSYLDSLTIYRDTGNKSSEAIALRNTGLSQESLENYEQALDYYQQSLAIEETLDSAEDKARILEDVGHAYRKLESYLEAINYYQQSLNVVQTLADFERAERLYRYTGFTYNVLEEYEKATDAYQQSLDFNRRMGDIANESHVLRLLGVAYGNRGEYGEALGYYRQSAELRDSAGKRDLLYSINNTLEQVRTAYQTKANVDLDTIISAYEDALFLHRDADVDLKEEEDSYFIDNLESITNRLFQLNWNKEDFSQAIYYLEQLSELREEETSELIYAFGQVETLLRLDLAVSADQTNAAITAHLDKLPTNNAAELSLLNILRRKGRVLDGLVIHSARDVPNAEAEDREILAEIKEINTLLANLHFEAATNRLADDAYAQEKRSLESRLTNLTISLSRIDDSSAQAQAVTQMKLSSIDDVRRLIPTNAALIELVVYQPYTLNGFLKGEPASARYAAYIMTQLGEVQAVDLGEKATIDRQIADYRRALKSPSSSVRDIARELDEMLMAPIRPLLGAKTHLLISPDGQLNVMPFDALIDEQGHYLIESYQTSYLTSGRDLLKLQASTAASRPAVIIADPDYASAVESLTSESAADAATVATTQNTDQRSADVEALRFLPLPGTATEANAIAPLLPDAIILTQRQATESQLKQLAAPRILHIATHGFFLPDTTFDATLDATSRSNLGASLELVDTKLEAALMPADYEIENPLLRSGLALAGVNARSSGGDGAIEDGIFTALEASNLNLRGTQLVVLSACETGLGATSDGDGVYGLRRAFAIAGAESQLMSLWQVDDYGTSEMMQLYYENLTEQKQGRSEALRNVQLELLNTGTYQHPYYWSSFILSGDWRALE